jgi:8-oxo-dGTP pyrophosphatase MutT (NUDIX family)
MTKHAQLPLWDDKSPDQKIDTLHDMMLDMYRYGLLDSYSEIIETLENHQPADDKEKADVEQIIRLIDEHPNIINKNCEIGHITGSALIVDVAQKRVLLHFHRKLNRWLQLGGHAEYEKYPHQIAEREAKEESGLIDLKLFPDTNKPTLIDVDVHTIPQQKNRPEHLHLDFRYAFSTNTPELVNGAEGESDQFLWIPLSDLENHRDMLSEELMRYMVKIRTYLSH